MRRLVLLTLALVGFALIPLSLAEDAKGEKHNVPPEGFVALFNGKDLTNWQGLVPILDRQKLAKDPEAYAKRVEAAKKVLKNWTVTDGVLYYDGKSNSLQTVKDYGNFELLLDWKIAEKGDSGIYLRGQPQVQIWDSDKAGGAQGKDKSSGSGALWNNPEDKGKRPLKKADKPVGEWNTFRIICEADKVTVYLNGELVCKEAPLLNFWEKGKPVPKKGPIELQHHGDPLWFRNIFIKELPDDKE
jgi:hypothetical protein